MYNVPASQPGRQPVSSQSGSQPPASKRPSQAARQPGRQPGSQPARQPGRPPPSHLAPGHPATASLQPSVCCTPIGPLRAVEPLGHQYRERSASYHELSRPRFGPLGQSFQWSRPSTCLVIASRSRPGHRLAPLRQAFTHCGASRRPRIVGRRGSRCGHWGIARCGARWWPVLGARSLLNFSSGLAS